MCPGRDKWTFDTACEEMEQDSETQSDSDNSMNGISMLLGMQQEWSHSEMNILQSLLAKLLLHLPKCASYIARDLRARAFFVACTSRGATKTVGSTGTGWSSGTS